MNPDEFYVFKTTFKKGFKPIIRKTLGDKKVKMIYGTGKEKALTYNVDVPELDRKKFCLSDEDVLTLANYAVIIEDHYSKMRRMPQEIKPS